MIEVRENGDLYIVWDGLIVARLEGGDYTCYDKESVVKSLRDTALSIKRRAKFDKNLSEGLI